MSCTNHYSFPTLLFVHGAWHGSWCWGPLRTILEHRGFRTAAIDLPTTTNHSTLSTGVFDDADCVRSAVQDIGGPVVVVAHSYGGVPVTQGLVGSTDEVRHIVYVAAFVLDVGMSLLGAFDGNVPPWWVDGGDTITPASPETVFYSDIPAAQAADLVAQLRPHSKRAYEDALTQAAYHTIPTTYVVCDLDNALPSIAQEGMAANCGSTRRIQSGHSPFLSQTDAFADLLESILGQDSTSRT
jgi:pimeloyl-ACP methyl ester carboxylesterase